MAGFGKHITGAGRSKSSLLTETSSTATEPNVEFFHETVTLTSAAAATAVNIIPDARVGSGRKVYLMGGVANVNGATPWGTTASIAIEDTAGVEFVVLAGTIATTLAANTTRFFNTDNAGSGNAAQTQDAFDIGSGGTAGSGLQVKGDANGTGSDLKVTVWGVIK